MKTMNGRSSTRAKRAMALILVAWGAAGYVRADDGEARRVSISHPAYKNECGSCHVAFPPTLLSAESWRAVMAGLDQHFGSDASLDATTAGDILRFLVTSAGPRNTQAANGTPIMRITETGWFRREHRDGHDGITPGIFRSEAVKSAANCGACHHGAADGDYSESGIRIPRAAR
jgi:hypothetical protein